MHAHALMHASDRGLGKRGAGVGGGEGNDNSWLLAGCLDLGDTTTPRHDTSAPLRPRRPRHGGGLGFASSSSSPLQSPLASAPSAPRLQHRASSLRHDNFRQFIPRASSWTASSAFHPCALAPSRSPLHFQLTTKGPPLPPSRRPCFQRPQHPRLSLPLPPPPSPARHRPPHASVRSASASAIGAMHH